MFEYWYSKMLGMYLVADKVTGELCGQFYTLTTMFVDYPEATFCEEMG